MKKTIIKKLQTNNGFSLSELLVALLILGLMTVGLTAGISASLRVYRDSVRHAEERTLLSTLSEAVMSELRSGIHIVPTTNEESGTGSGAVTDAEFTYESMNYGPDVKFGINSGRLALLNGDSVKAYLVGTGAYSNQQIELCPFSAPSGGTENESVNKIQSYVVYSCDEKGKDIFTVNLALKSGEYRHFKVTPIKENDLF